MTSIFRVPALVAGAVLIGLVGCESSSLTAVATDGAAAKPTESALAAALGRANGTVNVPITLRLATDWAVPGASEDDCPDLIDDETGELFTAFGSGTGQANHLGRVRFTGEHPTINLCSIREGLPPAPADVTRTGQFELVAADGSTLSGSYSVVLVPPELGGFMILIVEEGTRGFQRASGQLELSWEKSGDLECPDIVCLADVVLDPAVFEGTLALARP